MKNLDSDFVCVPIPTQVFLEVAEYLRQTQSTRTPSEFFCMAADYLRENIDSKPEDFGGLLESPRRGYMWKELFLPDGTQARMKYKGKWFYAEVSGDEFLFEGDALSPSQYAHRVTQSNRNAWRDVFIKRPGDSGWTLADTLRGSVRSLRQLAGMNK